MSGGLAALLDDIAAIAKVAAASIDDIGAAAGKASAKAVGVVVDDTAVTPRYVHGFLAQRELPIIWRIAKGSLRNKLVFILPVAILLSQFVPWADDAAADDRRHVPGLRGRREGARGAAAEKHGESPKEALAELGTPEHEKKMIAGAIRTDFILSAEIMAIALAEVAPEPLLSRILILAVVGVAITVLVYGVAGLIVKLDDIGLALAERKSKGVQALGRGLVAAMPHVMSVMSVVGIAAMIWVGGHLILVGANTLGLHAPYYFVHHLDEAARLRSPPWPASRRGSSRLSLRDGRPAGRVRRRRRRCTLTPRRRRGRSPSAPPPTSPGDHGSAGRTAPTGPQRAARSSASCSRTRTVAVPPLPSRLSIEPATVRTLRTSGVSCGEISTTWSAVRSVSSIPRLLAVADGLPRDLVGAGERDTLPYEPVGDVGGQREAARREVGEPLRMHAQCRHHPAPQAAAPPAGRVSRRPAPCPPGDRGCTPAAGP